MYLYIVLTTVQYLPRFCERTCGWFIRHNKHSNHLAMADNSNKGINSATKDDNNCVRSFLIQLYLIHAQRMWYIDCKCVKFHLLIITIMATIGYLYINLHENFTISQLPCMLLVIHAYQPPSGLGQSLTETHDLVGPQALSLYQSEGL